MVKKKQRKQADDHSLTFSGRDYTNYDPHQLKDNLVNLDWNHFYQAQSVNDKWDILYEQIEKEVNDQCPIKKFKFAASKPPYLTQDLIEQIKNRDYFYKKAKRLKNEDDWNIAVHLRNQTNRNIRRAKSDYILNLLDANKNDSSKFWRTIKDILPTEGKDSRRQIKLKENGREVPYDKTAQYINGFFINVGKPKRTNVTDINQHVYMTDNPNPTVNDPDPDFNFDPVTQAEVYNLTSKLNTRKSSGLTHMSPKVIKDSLLALNEQLTHIINTSLETSLFPNKWKEANVVPIPKAGDLSEVSNFRPISLLPTPGKILEKIVHTQLEAHLEENNLITELQHGFRKGRSTLHAVTQLVNHIALNLNNQTPTVALFIDFRKAFDCLQYPTLLAKLASLNLSKQTVDWLKDYLTDRRQQTLANGTASALDRITQGVPQGSILGPLLYILYADDISKTLGETKFAFYADDTVLYTSHKNINVAIKRVQEDLNKLEAWCEMNSIFINPNKTKYMIFSTKKVEDTHDKLKTSQAQLGKVSSFTYLGVRLDQHLTFDNHAQYIINRVTSKVYQLKKMRRFLSRKAALLVYKNMILPIIEYGDIYLSATSKENRNKLQKLQNKALKCALGRDKRYNTRKLHAEAKILPLARRRKLHLLYHVYQISHMPSFHGWKRRPTRNLRSSKKKLLKIKKPNIVKFQKSIAYQGPRTWNALPKDIQNTEFLAQFKQRAASHYNSIWKIKDANKNQLQDED